MRRLGMGHGVVNLYSGEAYEREPFGDIEQPVRSPPNGLTGPSSIPLCQPSEVVLQLCLWIGENPLSS